MNKLLFELMSLEYRIKSILLPPRTVLAETGIRNGDVVVDYGCGPGRYTIPTARIVGKEGRVHAVDNHPSAMAKVNRLARKHALPWISTVPADDLGTIPRNSADVVILYDTLHDLAEKRAAIREMGRLLKPEGLLSVKDHRLKRDELISIICEDDRFRLIAEHKRTLTFIRGGHETEG